MTDLSDRKARRTADALAYFCTHVDEIRHQLRAGQSADDTAVDRLLAAARDGQDVGTAVRLLHERLQASGDARGLYGRTRGPNIEPAGIGVAGIDGDDRPLTVLLCPHRRCTRHEWPDADAPAACGVDGTPLLPKSV
ncbi:hypothetical protein RM704_41015 [Streptomyces sp. DSM 3412]|uniref:Uncharacterized protein n=1 Tax=Streptomyces gottesmaniae TaxID=3075518 RepID=A0ABU2ZC15_9ACTN|nr:hypothetical protein [Streptomyces sp. DSM 3412]MDT0573756.1 hypothetical protein [Streptomyces sp. DSM 3412]